MKHRKRIRLVAGTATAVTGLVSMTAAACTAMARTSHAGAIVTTFPHDFYPGTEWKSAMLRGAAEIALADEALRAPRLPGAGRPGRRAHWAKVGERAAALAAR